MFFPMSGFFPVKFIWSVIETRSPGLKSELIPPAAFVKMRLSAPKNLRVLTEYTISSSEYPSYAWILPWKTAQTVSPIFPITNLPLCPATAVALKCGISA